MTTSPMSNRVSKTMTSNTYDEELGLSLYLCVMVISFVFCIGIDFYIILVTTLTFGRTKDHYCILSDLAGGS